jgi:hypothetical protein
MTTLEHAASGIPGFVAGSLFGDAMVPISDPTGTGKTLMVTQAAAKAQRAILFSFEESSDLGAAMPGAIGVLGQRQGIGGGVTYATARE